MDGREKTEGIKQKMNEEKQLAQTSAILKSEKNFYLFIPVWIANSYWNI